MTTTKDRHDAQTRRPAVAALRLTQIEKRMLEALARSRGLTVSTLARDLILTGLSVETDREAA